MLQISQLDELRKRHRKISYIKHSFEIRDDGLHIEYLFTLDPGIQFHHKVSFHCFDMSPASLSEQQLDLLIFNLGMVELISYYKLACPLQVAIHPYKLSSHEEAFWRKIYFNGLGEFMFVNQIHVEDMKRLEFSYGMLTEYSKPQSYEGYQSNVLIPVGGGKDSVVTLELSQKIKSLNRYILTVNPTKAAVRCSLISGIDKKKHMLVRRTIDPHLLDMNRSGFLNGHVPFSATIAFISLIAASLLKIKSILLSNESSANQSNIRYFDMDVNHQYSKSIEFEFDFRTYIYRYISGQSFDYFSLLRPLNELMISQLFAEMPEYHSAFISCNREGREDRWCGSCPKCLFVAVMLSPFLPRDKVIRIFSKDMLSDLRLSALLSALAGFGEHKPFECVGTYDEVRFALSMIKAKHSNHQAPLVHGFFTLYGEHMAKGVLTNDKWKHIAPDHFIPLGFLPLIL